MAKSRRIAIAHDLREARFLAQVGPEAQEQLGLRLNTAALRRDCYLRLGQHMLSRIPARVIRHIRRAVNQLSFGGR